MANNAAVFSYRSSVSVADLRFLEEWGTGINIDCVPASMHGNELLDALSIFGLVLDLNIRAIHHSELGQDSQFPRAACATFSTGEAAVTAVENGIQYGLESGHWIKVTPLFDYPLMTIDNIVEETTEDEFAKDLRRTLGPALFPQGLIGYKFFEGQTDRNGNYRPPYALIKFRNGMIGQQFKVLCKPGQRWKNHALAKTAGRTTKIAQVESPLFHLHLPKTVNHQLITRDSFPDTFRDKVLQVAVCKNVAYVWLKTYHDMRNLRQSREKEISI